MSEETTAVVAEPTEIPEEDRIGFYCKKCKELVEKNQVGKKYVYECNECGGKDVAFGTIRSLNEYYIRRNKG